MKNLAKPSVFILVVCLQILLLNLQPSQAQGPPPVGGGHPLNQVQVLRLPPVDVQKLLQEDKQRTIQGLPLRFAQPIPVHVTPATHGTWEQLDSDTRRWRLRIISADALSLNLGFSRYVMPDGGRLLIYTPDYQHIIGPFTSEDNETHGQLWTPLLAGDDIIIDVTVPAKAVSQLELVLSSVNHGYVEFGQPSPDKSGSCNVDVVCPAADNWRNEIRSVARYTISGSTLCSGSLLNNTSQDLTPYFLTAYHCNDGINASNAPSMVVYWNYETSVCGGTPDGSLAQFNTGAIFRAAYSPSDFALVELDDPIDDFNVYWAGWDNNAADPPEATTIHHPSGDEKRISFENDPTTTTSYLSNAVPGDGTHIRVADWDVGTTEPGSSGAPLFNQNNQVVGQLHGGYAACNNDSPDWFGRLSVSWEGGGTPDSRLRDWLDPGNSGLTTLNGTDALSVTPASLNVCVPDEGVYNVAVNSGGWGGSGPVTLSVSGNPQGTGLSLSQNPVTPPGSSILTLTNPAAVIGSYDLTITGMSATQTHSNTVRLNLIDKPDSVSLITPANGVISQTLVPQFEWSAAGGATTYNLEVASDLAFNTMVYSATVAGTSHLITTPLLSDATYYWRGTPQNSCGSGNTSSVSSFSTLSPICRTPNLTIPDNNPTGITDTMVISHSEPLTIAHLNVSISATHKWVGDLAFVLEHTDTGTRITLADRPGGPSCGGDDLDALFEDQATASVQNECATSVPAVAGILSPAEPLSAFEGEVLSGTWQLIASDNGFITEGTLVEWCLQPGVTVKTPVSDPGYLRFLPIILKE